MTPSQLFAATEQNILPHYLAHAGEKGAAERKRIEESCAFSEGPKRLTREEALKRIADKIESAPMQKRKIYEELGRLAAIHTNYLFDQVEKKVNGKMGYILDYRS